MNRASFLKSLFVVSAAPKVISEIDLTPKVLSVPTSTLINDLTFLTPNYYKQYVEKYNNLEWEWWLTNYGENTNEHKNAKEFFFHETGRSI